MTDFNQKTHDTDVGSHGGQSRQMMEVFENQEFGSIRLLQEAGKTFFCASDVAKALGYVNPYAAVKRHCRGPLTKREGVVQKVNQDGDAGEQVVEISFITEGDVYRLIVHSKLPSAERFEHWVFDEVLPSIRKHTPHRSRVVKTRMTEEEYADFTERLKNYDMSQAEFIRQAITRATIRPIVTVSPVNDELLSAVGKLTAEYGKIGGNLNQIARSLNEYGTPYNALSVEVRAAISDLAALKFEVLRKVGDAVGNIQTYQL